MEEQYNNFIIKYKEYGEDTIRLILKVLMQSKNIVTMNDVDYTIRKWAPVLQNAPNKSDFGIEDIETNNFDKFKSSQKQPNSDEKKNIVISDETIKNFYLKYGQQYAQSTWPIVLIKYIAPNASNADEIKSLIDEQIKYLGNSEYEAWVSKVTEWAKIIYPDMQVDFIKSIIYNYYSNKKEKIPLNEIITKFKIYSQSDEAYVKFLFNVLVMQFPTIDKEIIMKTVNEMTDKGKNRDAANLIDSVLKNMLSKNDNKTSNGTLRKLYYKNRPISQDILTQYMPYILALIASGLFTAWVFKNSIINEIVAWRLANSIKGNFVFQPDTMDTSDIDKAVRPTGILNSTGQIADNITGKIPVMGSITNQISSDSKNMHEEPGLLRTLINKKTSTDVKSKEEIQKGRLDVDIKKFEFENLKKIQEDIKNIKNNRQFIANNLKRTQELALFIDKSQGNQNTENELNQLLFQISIDSQLSAYSPEDIITNLDKLNEYQLKMLKNLINKISDEADSNAVKLFGKDVMKFVASGAKTIIEITKNIFNKMPKIKIEHVQNIINFAEILIRNIKNGTLELASESKDFILNFYAQHENKIKTGLIVSTVIFGAGMYLLVTGPIIALLIIIFVVIAASTKGFIALKNFTLNKAIDIKKSFEEGAKIITSNFEKYIKEKIKKTKEGIEEIGKGIKENIEGTEKNIEEIGKGIKEDIKEIGKGIKENIQETKEDIKGIGKGIKEDIKNDIKNIKFILNYIKNFLYNLKNISALYTALQFQQSNYEIIDSDNEPIPAPKNVVENVKKIKEKSDKNENIDIDIKDVDNELIEEKKNLNNINTNKISVDNWYIKITKWFEKIKDKIFNRGSSVTEPLLSKEEKINLNEPKGEEIEMKDISEIKEEQEMKDISETEEEEKMNLNAPKGEEIEMKDISEIKKEKINLNKPKEEETEMKDINKLKKENPSFEETLWPKYNLYEVKRMSDEQLSKIKNEDMDSDAIKYVKNKLGIQEKKDIEKKELSQSDQPKTEQAPSIPSTEKKELSQLNQPKTVPATLSLGTQQIQSNQPVNIQTKEEQKTMQSDRPGTTLISGKKSEEKSESVKEISGTSKSKSDIETPQIKYVSDDELKKLKKEAAKSTEKEEKILDEAMKIIEKNTKINTNTKIEQLQSRYMQEPETQRDIIEFLFNGYNGFLAYTYIVPKKRLYHYKDISEELNEEKIDEIMDERIKNTNTEDLIVSVRNINNYLTIIAQIDAYEASNLEKINDVYILATQANKKVLGYQKLYVETYAPKYKGLFTDAITNFELMMEDTSNIKIKSVMEKIK